MPKATFTLYKVTGSTETENEVTAKNPMFLGGDGGDIHTLSHGSYPIPAPKVIDQTTYSWELKISWKCTKAPNNYCKNFKFWGASTPPNAYVLVYAGTQTTWSQAVQTLSSIATTRQDTNYVSKATGLTLPVDDVVSDNGLDEIQAVGDYVRYLVLQLRVSYGAPQGAIGEQVFNRAHDEA